MIRPRAQVDVALAADAPLRLEHAQGWVLTVIAGKAWLTQESDTRDVLLREGMSYRVERQGLTLIEPLATETRTVLRLTPVRRRMAAWREENKLADGKSAGRRCLSVC